MIFGLFIAYTVLQDGKPTSPNFDITVEETVTVDDSSPKDAKNSVPNQCTGNFKLQEGRIASFATSLYNLSF